MKKLSILLLLTTVLYSHMAFCGTDFVNAPNSHSGEAQSLVNGMSTNVQMPTNMNNVPNYDPSKYHESIDHQSQDYLDQTKAEGQRLSNDPNSIVGQVGGVNQQALLHKQAIDPNDAFIQSSNNISGDPEHNFPWTEKTVDCSGSGTTSHKQVASSLDKCYVYNEVLKFNNLNGLALDADTNYTCDNNIISYKRVGKQNLKVSKVPLFDNISNTNTNLTGWIFHVVNGALKIDTQIPLTGYPVGGTSSTPVQSSTSHYPWSFHNSFSRGSNSHPSKHVGSHHYSTEVSFNITDKTKVDKLLLEKITGSNAINLYVNNKLVYAYGVKDSGQTSRAIKISEKIMPQSISYTYQKCVTHMKDDGDDEECTDAIGHYTIYHHNIDFNDGVILNHDTGSLNVSNINLLPFVQTGSNIIRLESYTFGSYPVNASFVGTKYSTQWLPYVYDKNQASSSDVCTETSHICLVKGSATLNGNDFGRQCLSQQQTLTCTIANVQNLGTCSIFNRTKTCSTLGMKCINRANGVCLKEEKTYICGNPKKTRSKTLDLKGKTVSGVNVSDNSCDTYTSDPQTFTYKSESCFIQNSDNSCAITEKLYTQMAEQISADPNACNTKIPEPKEDPAMGDAITQLGSALHMGKQMVGSGNAMKMFGGKVSTCRKSFIGGLNCCKTRPPVKTPLKEVWGKGADNVFTGRAVQNLLMACTGDEKILQVKKAKDLTIGLGRYCTHTIGNLGMGPCTMHKYVYCSFQNKLSKVFQVQARQQLHIGFGDADNPKCGGLTKEQFASLDMSKMNFSQYTKDIEDNIKVPNANDIGKAITGAVGNFYKQNPSIQH